MAIKPLTAEQLYDSLATATCRLQPADLGGPTFGLNRVLDQNRQNFLSKLRTPTGGNSTFQPGIPQALSLMNGSLTSDATDLENSDILVALWAPFFSNEDRVEVLFLAALARFPNEEEEEQFVSYLTRHESDEEQRQALGDMFWALLNSAEFALNH